MKYFVIENTRNRSNIILQVLKYLNPECICGGKGCKYTFVFIQLFVHSFGYLICGNGVSRRKCLNYNRSKMSATHLYLTHTWLMELEKLALDIVWQTRNVRGVQKCCLLSRTRRWVADCRSALIKSNKDRITPYFTHEQVQQLQIIRVLRGIKAKNWKKLCMFMFKC